MTHAATKVIGVSLALLWGVEAKGDILSPWRYIKNYQVGFDVGETTDTARLSFDIDRGAYDGADCEQSEDRPASSRCELTFQARSSNYGLFLEQPFKRQGLWHFDYDLGFQVRVIDDTFTYAGSDDPESIPVYDLRLHLYSIVAVPSVTVGITPKGAWPDLLLSLGPSGEWMWGSVNVNNRRQIVSGRGVMRRSSVLSIFSYQELELIFARFGKGYVGATYWSLEGDDHVEDGQLLPDRVGAMENLGMTTNKRFLGLKVLFK